MGFSSSANYRGHRRPTAWAWSEGCVSCDHVEILSVIMSYMLMLFASM